MWDSCQASPRDGGHFATSAIPTPLEHWSSAVLLHRSGWRCSHKKLCPASWLFSRLALAIPLLFLNLRDVVTCSDGKGEMKTGKDFEALTTEAAWSSSAWSRRAVPGTYPGCSMEALRNGRMDVAECGGNTFTERCTVWQWLTMCVSSFGSSLQIREKLSNVQGEEKIRPLRSRVPLDVNDLVQNIWICEN